MYIFSKNSIKNLESVHPDLQTLFLEVIKHRDCSVVDGLRTIEDQQKLYAQGRTEPGQVVTNCDGAVRRSNHQSGMAVDVIPYPEKYDEKALQTFGHFVKGVAVMLKRYGAIDSEIEWGGNWNFIDMPHYQIKL